MALAQNDQTLIHDAISKAIKKDTETAFEDLKKELIERLDREKDNIISGVVLNVMEYVNYKTIDRNLTITVLKREKPL